MSIYVILVYIYIFSSLNMLLSITLSRSKIKMEQSYEFLLFSFSGLHSIRWSRIPVKMATVISIDSLIDFYWHWQNRPILSSQRMLLLIGNTNDGWWQSLSVFLLNNCSLNINNYWRFLHNQGRYNYTPKLWYIIYIIFVYYQMRFYEVIHTALLYKRKTKHISVTICYSSS